MDNRYYRHNRRKYSLKVHIVLVTKYRKQLLQGSIADDVKQKILDIANTRGYEIIAMETDKDHIHFLLSYDATDRVCDIVKIVKQGGTTPITSTNANTPADTPAPSKNAITDKNISRNIYSNILLFLYLVYYCVPCILIMLIHLHLNRCDIVG